MREIDGDALNASISSIAEAAVFLLEQGYILLGKREDGGKRLRFDLQKQSDEGYISNFFGRGSFELRLTHEGRRHISEGEQNAPPDEAQDRRFARLAIEEARKSVSENDERVHPRVGAVVVKDGRVLSTAHRGEEPGNHAEFVALEKKLPDDAVAGATVYTTLEPCTTRNHPKIPCAERLVERKVGRVVIGMLDPDDRISGKGVRKLRKAGIETVLFPHDLAMEVEELNREFTRSCEQNVRTEVGPASMELWKEVAGLRNEFAEFKQSVETRERNREEVEHFPISFVFDQGSPGNYSGSFKNDSKYKLSIETIRILRGDTNHEAPLTEAVKPRKTENWTFEPGEGRTIFWGPQYEPISMLKSLVQSPKPRFPDGEVIPIKIELTITVGGKRLTKNFVRQVLFQGIQILPWGP
jgi:pyrimidine deaminase RibD-like protein